MNRGEYVVYSPRQEKYVGKNFTWTSFLEHAMIFLGNPTEELTGSGLEAVPVVTRRTVEEVDAHHSR